MGSYKYGGQFLWRDSKGQTRNPASYQGVLDDRRRQGAKDGLARWVTSSIVTGWVDRAMDVLQVLPDLLR